jgi:hypothetical protein
VATAVAPVAPNEGQPYTDDEIRLILNFAPTKANATLLAAPLGRTPKAIEQIYRFAVSERTKIRSSHPSKSKPGEARGYVEQIIRICADLEWCM